jgi:hypothetical protein
VEHEEVQVRAKFGDYERHFLSHKASNERYVAGKAIKLGHGNPASPPRRFR